MRVLIGCESSGIVRDAFARLGHDAWSCDLLPSQGGGKHLQGGLLRVLAESQGAWDLLIAHPPCTYLNVAGAWAFSDPDFAKYPGVGYHQKVSPRTLTGEARRVAREGALGFVRAILAADVPRICVENPVGCISTRIQRPTQYIQPYEFGEDASKKTGLWLKGLPALTATSYVTPRMVDGKPRWQKRSETYRGIAQAMAEQWGQPTTTTEVTQ